MATYNELLELFEANVLRRQVQVAVVDVANDVLAEADTVPYHTERYAWAAKAINVPAAEAQRFLMGVLVANKALTVAQIQAAETGANDSAVKTNVEALVDLFARADAA